MFELTKEENQSLRSQIVTLSWVAQDTFQWPLPKRGLRCFLHSKLSREAMKYVEKHH